MLGKSTIEHLISESNAKQTVTCGPDGCTNFTLVQFRIQEPGDFFIKVDWAPNVGRTGYPLGTLEFKGFTLNFSNVIATGLVKIMLLIYTIIDFTCYCCNLRKTRILAVSKRQTFTLNFEQKVLVLLNVAMILYFDPIGIAHTFSPTVFT